MARSGRGTDGIGAPAPSSARLQVEHWTGHDARQEDETMNAQQRDLAASRAGYEREGEVYGCAECGAPLPPVSSGHVSDFCGACDRALFGIMREETHAA